jgi:hypothetical protein
MQATSRRHGCRDLPRRIVVQHRKPVLTIRATVCGSPHQELSKTRSPAFGQLLCSIKSSAYRKVVFPHSKLASVLFLDRTLL